MARYTRLRGTPRFALRLAPLFWMVSCVILAACAVLAAAPSLEGSWQRVAQSRLTVEQVVRLDAGIKAAWEVSAERGPTNGLLGAHADEAPIWRARLAAQRAASDRALAHLHDLLSSNADGQPSDEAPVVVQTIRDLRLRRGQIDRLAAEPLIRRDPQTMVQQVDGMIALVTPLAGLNVRTGAAIVRHDPSLADNIAIAQFAADLRESVGQAGSCVAVGLFRQQGLSSQQRRKIDRLEGRIDELQFLMTTRLAHYSDGADLPALRSLPIAQDLAQGANLVEATLAATQAAQAPMVQRVNAAAGAGMPGPATALTPGEFTDRYVPRMASVEALPDLVLDAATRRAQRLHETAVAWLWVTGAALATVLGIVTVAGVLVHRCLVRPLAAVTAHLRAIVAESGPGGAAVAPRSEIGDLLHASAALRQANRRRRRLERERDALLQRLGRMADTDHLTGLLNRRVFDADGARALADGKEIALLLCDIDYFKQINDRLGHAAGDRVLLRMAQRLQSALHSADALYRYGGEEFVVIVETDNDFILPVSLAERLRDTLENTPFAVGGETLRVTISIGVTWSLSGDDLGTLVGRADQALYRAKRDGRNCVRTSAD
ncbi:GGDEF domain-containing protein [Paraburkholderia phenazinium]|nr:GGDEF domain-containing protein [Paraburkholderia phenazinium]